MPAALSTEGFAEDLDRIKFALDAAGIGVWELDLTSNRLIWDSRCRALFGFPTTQESIPLEEAFRFIYEEDIQSIQDVLGNVLKCGETRVFEVSYRVLQEDKRLCWIHAIGTSYFDEKGQIKRFGGIVRDVTEKRTAQQKVQNSRQQTLSLLQDMPVAVAITDRQDFRFTSVNPLYCKLVGHPPEALLGRPLPEVFPAARAAGVEGILRGVLDTGEPFLSSEERVVLVRQGRKEIAYINFSYQALRDEQEVISSVLISATDVTRQVEARMKIENSALRFQNLLQSASVGIILLLGEDLRVEMVNEAYCRLAGFPERALLHRPLFEVVPDAEAYFRPIIEKVCTTGEEYQLLNTPFDMRNADGGMEKGFVNIVYQPYREEKNGAICGVLILVYEVTEQVVANRKALESEAKFRLLIEEAPFATALYMGPQLVIDTANDAMIRVWGRTPAVIGMPLAKALPELEGQPFIGLLEAVMRTGVAYSAAEQEARLVVDGRLQSYWFNFTYKPLRNPAGEVYAILNMAVDITAQVNARKELQESEANLAAAMDLAELATWSIDSATGAVTYSERLQKWLGMETAVLRADGSPRIHPKDRERVAAAIQRAIAPDGNGHYDEVYTITNALTDATRVIHAVGKAQRDSQGNTVQLSGIAQDITLQQDLQSALENEVQLRTEQLDEAVKKLRASNETLEDLNEKLQRSNEELAQYAYVASHDLQEPLRKIQIFSGLLQGDKMLSEKSRDLTEKIIASSDRMSQLIRDLLHLSRLLQSDMNAHPVDLQAVVQEALTIYEIPAGEKHAQFHIAALPTIEAIGLQMGQLFSNLIGNGLKFTRPGISPVLTISASPATEEEVQQRIRLPRPGVVYHKICVKDNGIGFEQAYAEQIFEVFKRLHSRDAYPGSGIGLALCRRIAANHGGALFAESAPGKGATFCVILPAQAVGADAL